MCRAWISRRAGGQVGNSKEGRPWPRVNRTIHRSGTALRKKLERSDDGQDTVQRPHHDCMTLARPAQAGASAAVLPYCGTGRKKLRPSPRGQFGRGAFSGDMALQPSSLAAEGEAVRLGSGRYGISREES
jgi:hypothetical protein